MENQRAKRLERGLYRILMTGIVLAAVILVNLIVRKLPVEISSPDFSSSRLYTLTDTTEAFLDTLDKDVTLYYICSAGKEDDNVWRLLNRYKDACSHLSLQKKDPAVYPGFVKKYTDQRVSDNSIIVEGPKRSRVVYAEDLYSVGTSAVTGRSIETAFNAEGLITSAIGYVVSDSSQIMYALNANGEANLGSSFRDAVEKNNIEIRPLNLIAEDAVPEDASALLLNAPAADYSEEVTDKILRYLEKGGKALLFTNYSLDAMPNVDKILENYGLKRLEGILLEGDSSRYMTYPYCVIPSVNYTRLTANVYENAYLLLPMCQGISVLDTYRASITMQPLLGTSDAAYSKVDVQNMTTSEKEAGDLPGPFTIGMAVYEDINNDGTDDTELVYFSTGYLLDEDYNENVSGSNARLFGDTVNALCNSGENSAVVAGRNLQVQVLTIDSFSANFWTVVCVFLIPALIILSGLRIWLGRRKQ